MRKEKAKEKRKKRKKASSKTKTVANERALSSESNFKLFVLLFIHCVKARDILVPCTVSK